MFTRSASGVLKICSRCALLEHAINMVETRCLLALAYYKITHGRHGTSVGATGI
jgi:hypothetical protein